MRFSTQRPARSHPYGSVFKNRSPKKHRIQTPTKSNRWSVRQPCKSLHVCLGLVRGVSYESTRWPWLNMDSVIKTVDVRLVLVGLQNTPAWTAKLCAPRSGRWGKSADLCGPDHSDGPDHISFPGYVGNRNSCVCQRLNVFHRCHAVP